MKNILEVFTFCMLIYVTVSAPPRRNEQETIKEELPKDPNGIEDFGLEYDRYLREVVGLLESDPQFKKKLEEAPEVDIRTGVIAKELEFVDHRVRSKLDEVKRQEIERLRHLAQKQTELSNNIDTQHAKISSEHLDHGNPHTFEMEDLKKLIAKVSADLTEADVKRRQEFKEYEMQKEFEKQEKLKHLKGKERDEYEKQLKEQETKHKQHEPLHKPGSKQQLEEVWEKQDHMENQEFDPKVFFQLHDLDGNKFWDQNEVKALFLKELDKMYEAGAPEDDMKERMEEMERMREHVFKEADKNNDGLISYKEFLEKTKQPEFEKDPGWETLDQKPVYTQEEYQEFEKRRQMEIQRMIDQGLIPPQPIYHPDYHPQMHYPPYHHPPQYQGYQGNHIPPMDQRYAGHLPNQPPYQVHSPDHANQGYQYQQQKGHMSKEAQAHMEQKGKQPSVHGPAETHPNELHSTQQQQLQPNKIPGAHEQPHPNALPQNYQSQQNHDRSNNQNAYPNHVSGAQQMGIDQPAPNSQEYRGKSQEYKPVKEEQLNHAPEPNFNSKVGQIQQNKDSQFNNQHSKFSK